MEDVEREEVEQQPDSLDWTEEELAAMSGEADREPEPEEVPGRDEDAEQVSEDVRGSVDGMGDGEKVSADGDTEARAFLDTRERKESYTPEEWAKLVRQRDYYLRREGELQSEIAKVSDRVEKMSEVILAQREEPAPDREDDPVGHLDYEIKGVNSKVDSMLSTLEQERQLREVATRQQQFEQMSAQAVARYLEKSQQDETVFQQKLKALRQDRYDDFLEEGFTDDQAFRLLVGWENQMIATAFQRGENPAEVLDRRFQRRGLKVEGNGKLAEPVQRSSGPSAQEVVTRAQKGVKTQPKKEQTLERGKSFKVTYESLASMSPEEFNEVMDKIQGTSKEDELDLLKATTIVL